MIFSPIQNHILSKLKNASTLRYRDLHPKGIPNDLFNYHLQFLVKKDYVSHGSNGYSLAEKGIKRVADVLDGDKNILSLYKLNVILIISRKNKDKIEILNQLRKSHPSYGKIGVVGGLVRKGESLEVAAKRKLKAETGLEATFKPLGIERRIMYKKNELFSDMLFPIMYADKYSGELQTETEFGENFWVSIEQAIKNESGDFDTLKKVVDVLKSIKTGKVKRLPFFYQEDIQVDA